MNLTSDFHDYDYYFFGIYNSVQNSGSPWLPEFPPGHQTLRQEEPDRLLINLGDRWFSCQCSPRQCLGRNHWLPGVTRL